MLFQNELVSKRGVSGVPTPARFLFGRLVLAKPRSKRPSWFAGPNVTRFAAVHPQPTKGLGDESPYDSDPYAIAPHRHGYAIADAAANSVLWLSPSGSLSLIARLPAVKAVGGLTAITDLAFDRQGRLLILEYNTGGLLAPPSTPGALVRVSKSGQVTTLPIKGLHSPTGLAVGTGGAVYISNNGTSSVTSSPPGEVLKITGLN